MNETPDRDIILIVDDKPRNLEILSHFLTDAGFKITVAIDGESAIEQIKYYPPDLILLDVMMPGIDGFETCRRLKEEPLLKDIPVIFMTALSDTENKVKGLNIGAVDYITKPFQIEEVLARVKVHLKLRHLKEAMEVQNIHLQKEISERIAAETALQKLTEELEERVEKRTAELSQALHKIETLYEDLRASQSRLEQFLEAVPVGVAVIDAEGQPCYANQKAKQLLGKGVMPDTLCDRIPEIYQNYIAGTDRLYPYEKLPIVQALKGERVTVDDIEIHQGDTIIPVEGWGTPIYDENGKITYGIVAFQDITDRKKAEVERSNFTHLLFELNEAYERFVPRQFFQFLGKESIMDVELGDHVQKEMSILFADIRAFTTLSERMTPEQNFKFINSYLSRMEPVIIEYHGFIDKYIGDEIMALFSRGADDAVKAGIAMLKALVDYNQGRERAGYLPIQIGIGINTGSLMLGTVGGHNRMDGTVISDAVNLGSRLERLTKDYGVSLLISHHTFWDLQDSTQYAFRIVDRVKVKGKEEMVSVFEVFDADPPHILESKLATKRVFEEALLLYYLQNFREATQLFQECLRQNPMDKVAQIYLDRCQQHRP